MTTCTVKVEAKFSELVDLIQKTDSMDDNDRTYWFDLLDKNVNNDIHWMTDEQANTLQDILITERDWLARLELQYSEEIRSLNERHLRTWEDNFEDKPRLSTKNDPSENEETLWVSE